MNDRVHRSDHFDGRRFHNPTGPEPQPFTAVPRLMLERGAPWPAWIESAAVKPPALGSEAALVTFIGHSTFLLQTAAGAVLTDPMYSMRAGPFNLFGPRRVRPPAVRLEDLPPIAVILLSHNHYDHCDLTTLSTLARRCDPAVVTPVGNRRLFQSTGLRHITELDWWDSTRLSGLTISVTPAHHFSARTPFDRNRALWSGFVIGIGQRRIYFAGDTAYAPFFPEIPRRLGPPDLALIPIGAYEPRWFMRAVHMNPAEAVQAHLDVQSRLSVGMHFGTFQLTTEPMDEPVRALSAALHERGIAPDRFRTLDFGETLTLV